ncbi:para-nitrobenzyl esterase [Saccharothrix coeruleofusca]|uniref:carboxylesterase/lipase family protein n=1 Tax=Saccharothrix coeruleofusca TaxID=33919 RepID=UPI001FD62F06|nr:carboxylesterase family protein [Saccharothrix coeruleofusca]MBP2340614.1 para-nitrobenzyl esterase [Saccharothrix coeruleofusca]
MTRHLALALALVLLLGATSGGQAMDDHTTKTDTGVVRGLRKADHLLFQGIPYAAKPGRWEAPHRARPWPGVLDATAPGSPCPQVGSPYSELRSTEEECLFLNVTTPSTRGRRPVLVWLHGDGAIGAGHFFDAARLAVLGDAVVVTVNYRLGVFGGFGMPGLAGSGEFGLMDQRAALAWVRRNAGAFGGDADNVTLFGVSYGATAVAAHLMSPHSRGLFDKAALHSSFTLVDLPAGAWFPNLPALPWLAWRPPAEIEALGAAVAAELNCADVACLRAQPVERVLDHPDVMNIFQAMPFQGGPPDEVLGRGEFAEVPVLAGNTKDEHRSLVRVFRGEVAREEYPHLLEAAFGAHAPDVLAEYPLSDYPDATRAWAQVLTDRVWARPTWQQHRFLSAHNPVYAFEFADPRASADGAGHNSDIGYLFVEPGNKFTPEQCELSDQMIRYWTNFARSGDPNGDGLPAWPRFDHGGHVQSLAPNAIEGVDYRTTHRLGFWEGR